jgi:hypothetical protein
MTRIHGRALLLALPLSLGCSVDASGLSADDATSSLDAADDTTIADALFEVGPPDDTGPPDTGGGFDGPLFEAADAGCIDTTTCPPPAPCMLATCTAGACGETPQAQRTACASSGGKLCDGAGACVACLLSSDCTTTAAPNCVSRQCVAASCMDGMKNGTETDVDCGGTCSKCALGSSCKVAGDCQSNVCGAGSKCGCSADAQCGSGKFCDPTGACKPLIATGKACTRPGECTLGFCVDGFCCNVACNGTCQACAGSKKQVGGMDGTCGPAKDGTDPHSTCAAGPTCGNTGQCMGGACQLAPTTTSCGAATCVGSTATASRSCDGAGTCNPPSTSSCAPYLCETAGTKCKNTCALASDCTSGYTCIGIACVALKSNGATCVSGIECSSGNCVTGVCCNTACGGTCMGCAVAPAVGTCTNLPASAPDVVHGCSVTQACNGSGACLLATGQSCTGDAQCASNNCKLAGMSGSGSCN